MVVQDTQDVVVVVTLHHLDHTALHRVDMVQTVGHSMLVVLVVMDLEAI